MCLKKVFYLYKISIYQSNTHRKCMPFNNDMCMFKQRESKCLLEGNFKKVSKRVSNELSVRFISEKN